MRSGNPALNDSSFTSVGSSADNMTLEGTATKTLLALLLVVVAAGYTFHLSTSELVAKDVQVIEEEGRLAQLGSVPASTWGFIVVGSLSAFVVAIIYCFNPKAWPLVLVYASLEGLAVGSWSAMFEYMYPNVVAPAALLTFGILFSLLILYKMKFIQATENFKLAVFAATGGVCLYYIINMVSRGFFGYEMPLIYDTGIGGIIFSLVVVGIAAANLVWDFDFIEKGVEYKAPKYMEWYGAFGLMVTLIWLYLELVRLLAKASANSSSSD